MITLEIDGTSPLVTIDLRNPVFGNSQKYDNHRIINKSIHDYNTQAQNSDTPEFTTLVFNFETMSQYSDFVTFMTSAIGKKLTLTNYDANEYQGVIVGPIEYSNHRTKSCSMAWGFTFEVETIVS